VEIYVSDFNDRKKPLTINRFDFGIGLFFTATRRDIGGERARDDSETGVNGEHDVNDYATRLFAMALP